MDGRAIVSPVGLSLLRRLTLKPDDGILEPRNAEQLQARCRALGDAARSVSAEIATLDALHAGPGDVAAFLATDTGDSEKAAAANASLALDLFGVETQCSRISGLVLDDADRFRREGIPALSTIHDRCLQAASERGQQTILSVSGGIKPVVPYVAVYGMLRCVTVVYIFEQTRGLITLPPLPIDFDWEALARAAPLLHEIERSSTVDRYRLTGLLGDELSKLEGLFETVDGEVTLSAFGLMLLGSVQTSRETPVMLSPSANRKLSELQGTDRKAIEAMLDRVRNPILRAHKRHEFTGTDLDVYKPGRTRCRLAYWVENGRVHVAEVYTDHDNYEADLPHRCRSQYRGKDCVPYQPTAPTADAGTGSDEDETLDAARREVQRAEQAREQLRAERDEARAEQDEALRLAADREDECGRLQTRAQDLEHRVAELAEAREQMNSWSFWRRLRWALSPR